MSNDKNVQDSYNHGGFNSSTAANIGFNQAHQGQTPSGQQHNEDFSLWQQRDAAFQAEKRRQEEERNRNGG